MVVVEVLSEPMYKLGANVVGIDASKKNIEIAKFHAKKIILKLIIYVLSRSIKTKKNLMYFEHGNSWTCWRYKFFHKKSSELLKKKD